MSAVAVIYGITSALTVACGIGVLLARRPLIAGFLLTAAMIGLGFLFWELHSPMLAGIQILVYGGGVLVMVLFVVMLTPSGQSLPSISWPWRAVWLLVPLSGYLAARTYPAHAPQISGRQLGQWLLMRQGLPLEVLGVLLLLALAAVLAIAQAQSEEGRS